MVSERLKKKSEVISQENNPGNHFELEYYMTEGVCSDEGEINGRKVFGIKIVKKIGNKVIEETKINNLSCYREYVEDILDKLSLNTVTPIGLPFIIDDMLGI
jgi:hypothetical protein